MHTSLKKIPPYFDQVYDVTRLIPCGRISTYGAIADFLALGSARMVGWALNHCSKYAMDVPAHRVVNRNGELTGRLHFLPIGRMEELLLKEGVSVEDNKVINFAQLFWSPMELLK